MSSICVGDHFVDANQKAFKKLMETNPFIVCTMSITEIKNYRTVIDLLC